MSILRSDFAEIWTHGNILQMARDLCGRFGWKVEQSIPDPCKGDGYIVINKESRFVKIRYGLPEHPDLMHDKLVGAMEVRRK